MGYLAAGSAVSAQESPKKGSLQPAAASGTASDSTKNRPITVAAPPNQFTSMDANKDGKISVSEYKSATMAGFRAMDRDHDGKVSGVELTEAEPAASGAPSPLSSAQIGEIDSNKDLQLTAKEVAEGTTRMFNNLDINHDHFLNTDELNGRQYRTDTEASADSRKNNSNDAAADNRH
jgi:Ca2+-binding EF-hand superfamily protein